MVWANFYWHLLRNSMSFRFSLFFGDFMLKSICIWKKKSMVCKQCWQFVIFRRNHALLNSEENGWSQSLNQLLSWCARDVLVYYRSFTNNQELLWQGGWTRWSPEVPSNPYHSVILWFCDFPRNHTGFCKASSDVFMQHWNLKVADTSPYIKLSLCKMGIIPHSDETLD